MTQADSGLHEEIHSLAAEIVHAYEELHLLYELGQVLTSDLTVSEVTSLIVEKIFQALNAGDAELSKNDVLIAEPGAELPALQAGAQGVHLMEFCRTAAAL